MEYKDILLTFCTRFSILLLLVTLTGCSGIGKGMLRVKYLGDSNSMDSKPIPKGFKISPADAVQIANRLNGPKKTVDDLYVDNEYYYVCDGFTGSIPQTAIDQGLKINGKTGQIFDRETQTWLPDPRDDN